MWASKAESKSGRDWMVSEAGYRMFWITWRLSMRMYKQIDTLTVGYIYCWIQKAWICSFCSNKNGSQAFV